MREALESDGDAVAADLHIWQIGPADCATAITVVAGRPKTPEDYRRRITAAVPSLTHVTLEVNRGPSS